MQIFVSERKAYLSSINNTYTIYLRKDSDDSLIPDGYDIIDTTVKLPDEVLALHLLMGGMVVATFTQDNIHELRHFPIYLSKARYYVACVQIVYDKEFLMEHEGFSMVDEMVEKESLGEYVEIFDGQDYHMGRIVERTEVFTGNQIRNITKEVPVDLPQIVFDIQPSDNKQEYVEVPMRQLVTLSKCDKEKYQERFNLEVVTEDEDKPYIQGYVNNYIMYKEGLAGLKYAF